ncbi:hypothetical protein LAZ67_1007006 [Cordylochernes scorpioides]|uniref:Uncharacterized protein n=1 Tax=Cordylochernes scorpioides TaxID=51811 RepID=A0ABY6JZU5_9ARAC|nr:hypothetical protein LAZ67_1007006 [Cordylochernes scorpioides]
MQEEGEPIDKFITSLYNLAESCEYATLHDEMIRDRIVVGVRDKNLSERLQLDESLTLEKAVKTVRQFEAVQKQQDDLRKPCNLKVNQKWKKKQTMIKEVTSDESTSSPNAFLLTLAGLKGSEPCIETLKLDNIACAGMLKGKLKYGDVEIEEPIYVTYQMSEPLLGGNADVKLKLLVRLNSLKATDALSRHNR